MKYLHTEPQITNETLAAEMAYAYDPYHNVKQVAFEQELPELVTAIETAGENASLAAGMRYIDSIRAETTADPEISQKLSATKQAFAPVLAALVELGDKSLIEQVEAKQAEEQHRTVREFKKDLERSLTNNLSPLRLADGEGNFYQDVPFATSSSFETFAKERGISVRIARNAWKAATDLRDGVNPPVINDNGKPSHYRDFNSVVVPALAAYLPEAAQPNTNGRDLSGRSEAVVEFIRAYTTEALQAVEAES